MSLGYFDFFGIPLSFFPDEEKIRNTYYTFSREFHPDFFGQESAEKQAEALQKSTYTTEAYKTLSSFEKRLVYILELEGIISKDEKYVLGQDFLFDMMDLNEQISESRENGDEKSLENYRRQVQEMETGFDHDIKSLCRDFDKSGNRETLERIKDLYYKRKYLKRLHENISGFSDDDD